MAWTKRRRSPRLPSHSAGLGQGVGSLPGEGAQAVSQRQARVDPCPCSVGNVPCRSGIHARAHTSSHDAAPRPRAAYARSRSRAGRQLVHAVALAPGRPFPRVATPRAQAAGRERSGSGTHPRKFSGGFLDSPGSPTGQPQGWRVCGRRARPRGRWDAGGRSRWHTGWRRRRKNSMRLESLGGVVHAGDARRPSLGDQWTAPAFEWPAARSGDRCRAAASGQPRVEGILAEVLNEEGWYSSYLACRQLNCWQWPSLPKSDKTSRP